MKCRKTGEIGEVSDVFDECNVSTEAFVAQCSKNDSSRVHRKSETSFSRCCGASTQRRTNLPLSVLLVLFLSFSHISAWQTSHESMKSRKLKMTALSTFQFAFAYNINSRKIVSHIHKSKPLKLNHTVLGNRFRPNTRLLSHSARDLDQLTLSTATTTPTIPQHRIGFGSSPSRHDAATALEKDTPITEIITQTSQALIDHVTNKRTSDETDVKIKCWEKEFSFDLPEGKCVGIQLFSFPDTHPDSLELPQIESNDNHWVKRLLHPHEVQYGIDLPTEDARMTFYLGRLAMRHALELACDEDKTCDVGMIRSLFSMKQQSEILPSVSVLDPSILKDQHGRPVVPKGFLGSISHKQRKGVALVSPEECDGSSSKRGVGVDIEQTYSKRINIAKKVLTERERNDLGKITGVTKDEEVLLRFSLKECVYKAMHPLICQWVGFQEAEITPLNDGTAKVRLNLKSGAHTQFHEVKAHWRRIKIDGDFFLTSSSVTLKEED